MTPVSLPILFLDFDGVLVDQAQCDNWIDEFGPAFNAEKLGYIHSLQQETDCRIVVISSWRNRAEGGKQAMQRMMDERGIALHIDDTVLLKNDPHIAETAGNRSREIDLWLDDHAHENISHIAILDDSMRNGYFSEHHFAVHVQPFWTGMTETDYQLVRGVLLNGPNQALANRSAPIPASLRKFDIF